LIAVQTPQAFSTDLLGRAHELAERDRFGADDDAALVEHMGIEVHVVAGETRNLKVTTADDLAILEQFLEPTSEKELAVERRDGS
jgi:2-C-methyl-D-erythritol 4-phosphate cytidylyltransferase